MAAPAIVFLVIGVAILAFGIWIIKSAALPIKAVKQVKPDNIHLLNAAHKIGKKAYPYWRMALGIALALMGAFSIIVALVMLAGLG